MRNNDRFWAIVSIGVTVVIALTLLLVSCVISTDWWNLFILPPLAFAVIPYTLFTQDHRLSYMSEDNNGWKGFAEFFTGFLLSASWAVVVITYHLGLAQKSSFVLGLLSNVFFFGAGGLYFYWEQRNDGYVFFG